MELACSLERIIPTTRHHAVDTLVIKAPLNSSEVIWDLFHSFGWNLSLDFDPDVQALYSKHPFFNLSEQ